MLPSPEGASYQPGGYRRPCPEPLPAWEKGYISGTFLLCGVPEEGCNFASLTAGQQKEFQDIFARPGEFMMVAGTAYADPDDVADIVYGLWDSLSDGDTVVLTKWGGIESGA